MVDFSGIFFAKTGITLICSFTARRLKQLTVIKNSIKKNP
jgi:hypothetical protein